jgi:hypothetical protein
MARVRALVLRALGVEDVAAPPPAEVTAAPAIPFSAQPTASKGSAQ